MPTSSDGFRTRIVALHFFGFKKSAAGRYLMRALRKRIESYGSSLCTIVLFRYFLYKNEILFTPKCKENTQIEPLVPLLG